MAQDSYDWSWTGASEYITANIGFLAFQRIQSTPIIANHNQGGGTIGGLQADALAAPAACWDGTRWVMTLSIWNIANSQWSSAFFTSPDLSTWTYVPNSLVSPTGGDYLIGNSGLAWFRGKYYWAYNHYPMSSQAGTTLAYSTDLVNWTIVGDPIISSMETRFDPALSVNPTTGFLELWSMGEATAMPAARPLLLDTSADGVTWSNNYSSPLEECPAGYLPSVFGEPQGFYSSGRFMTTDLAVVDGHRSTSFWSGGGAPSFCGLVLGPDAANAWENVQVFDACCVGPFDRGDGRGPQFWMLYAGGDVVSNTDNTDSCIGLAYLPYSGASPSTDPGIANVYNGVSYEIDGTSLVGTATTAAQQLTTDQATVATSSGFITS